MTLREWWGSLERPPEPLTPRQWLILTGASLLAAVSRWFALARTPWDWDELLFMLSLDHFNVAQHRPHPPGFPLYILAAKVVRKLGFGNFHALQVVSFLGAIAIVPAMFFLCRGSCVSRPRFRRRCCSRFSKRLVLRRRRVQRCAVDDACRRRLRAPDGRLPQSGYLSRGSGPARNLGGIPAAESPHRVCAARHREHLAGSEKFGARHQRHRIAGNDCRGQLSHRGIPHRVDRISRGRPNASGLHRARRFVPFADAAAAMARLRRLLRDALSRAGDQRDHRRFLSDRDRATAAAFARCDRGIWRVFDRQLADARSLQRQPLLDRLRAADRDSGSRWTAIRCPTPRASGSRHRRRDHDRLDLAGSVGCAAEHRAARGGSRLDSQSCRSPARRSRRHRWCRCGVVPARLQAAIHRRNAAASELGDAPAGLLPPRGAQRLIARGELHPAARQVVGSGPATLLRGLGEADCGEGGFRQGMVSGRRGGSSSLALDGRPW